MKLCQCIADKTVHSLHGKKFPVIDLSSPQVATPRSSDPCNGRSNESNQGVRNARFYC